MWLAFDAEPRQLGVDGFDGHSVSDRLVDDVGDGLARRFVLGRDASEQLVAADDEVVSSNSEREAASCISM